MKKEEILLKLSKQNMPILIVGEIGLNKLFFISRINQVDRQEFLGDQMTIENVREILHFLSFSPVISDKKIIIIKNIEKLNIPSANALLKTLEEPPSHALIILVSQDEQKILPTIISRCIKIRINNDVNNEIPGGYVNIEKFRLMSIKDRFKWVVEISENEKSEIENIIYLWIKEYRDKLLSGEDVLEILRKLLRAKDLLWTNISVKLLLENIVINF